MKNKKILIAIFSLLYSSNLTFGQINLGTAANFVLFTAAGAFDNFGASNIVGDIGTNVGVVSGFPPGNLTGQIHQANSTTAQAAIDVDSAYSYLSGVPCDSILGNALGSSQILTPRVYCIPTAATLNGDLILDGENNPNALFIIKVNGILDVIAYSKIILINAASQSNVYWHINGAVNVGDTAIFKGIIVGNGALSFAEGSVLNGIGLTRAGAITTNQANLTIPSASQMPIELIKFDGENRLTHNLISWSTASEMNNSHFTLESTNDGINYIELIRINGAGTSTFTNNYTYSDFDFEKKQNYYRLSQTDYDGKSETFDIISIDNSQTPKIIVKVLNMIGQEVDKDYIGLRVIYFKNGEIVKIIGKYIDNL